MNDINEIEPKLIMDHRFFFVFFVYVNYSIILMYIKLMKKFSVFLMSLFNQLVSSLLYIQTYGRFNFYLFLFYIYMFCLIYMFLSLQQCIIASLLIAYTGKLKYNYKCHARVNNMIICFTAHLKQLVSLFNIKNQQRKLCFYCLNSVSVIFCDIT